MKYLCLAYGSEEKMSALSKEDMDSLIGRCQTYDRSFRSPAIWSPG